MTGKKSLRLGHRVKGERMPGAETEQAEAACTPYVMLKSLNVMLKEIGEF